MNELTQAAVVLVYLSLQAPASSWKVNGSSTASNQNSDAFIKSVSISVLRSSYQRGCGT